MKAPDFFIVGAPKCGTTALAAYLAEHPGAFVSNPKEPNFFNSDIALGIENAADYERLFEAAPADTLLGEASVWYLYSEVAVEGILRVNPDARLIVMLRNPVDMVVSLHRQMVFSGYEDVEDFWTAWGLQAERSQGRKVPRGCPDARLLQYRQTCALGSQLQRFFNVTSPAQRLFVVYDDFSAAPREQWLRVLDFLGLPDDGRDTFPVINPASVRRFMPLVKLSGAYARVRRRLGFGGFGTGVFATLDEFNQIEAPAPALPQAQRVALVEAFTQEIDLLEHLLQRDLGRWRQT